MTDGNQSGRDAVVIGGGLAGITTALALADAGVRVTLLEGRPRLGGLAFSFQRGESASSRMRTWDGESKFPGTCMANQAPGFSAPSHPASIS